MEPSEVCIYYLTEADMLGTKLQSLLKVPYLSTVDPNSPRFYPEVEGLYWGDMLCPVINLVVERGEICRNVYFMRDIGTYSTSLCEKALKSLFAGSKIIGPVKVKINGVEKYVDQTDETAENGKFKGLNILGQDFFIQSQPQVLEDFKELKFKIVFPKKE